MKKQRRGLNRYNVMRDSWRSLDCRWRRSLVEPRFVDKRNHKANMKERFTYIETPTIRKYKMLQDLKLGNIIDNKQHQNYVQLIFDINNIILWNHLLRVPIRRTHDTVETCYQVQELLSGQLSRLKNYGDVHIMRVCLFTLGQSLCTNRGWHGCVHNNTVDQLLSKFYIKCH